MNFAPRSRACITHRNPIGCCSAIDEPMIRIASALARSCCAVVAPPRPNEVPRPGTVELCHIRAWLLTRGSCQGRPSRASCRDSSLRCRALRRPGARCLRTASGRRRLAPRRTCARGSPTRDPRSCPSRARVASSVHSVLCGARYLTRSSRPGWWSSWWLAAPFGQRWPSEIGDSGSPSMFTICPPRWKTSWPQPTPQYGHTERATSAPAFFGASASVRALMASRPVPGSPSRSCL